MVNPLKRILALIICGIVIVSIIGVTTFFNDLRSHREVSEGDVDVLTGQRVGVMCAWEADYLLEPRKDITLKRYDEISGLVLGLSYNQVDAAAIDEVSLAMLQKSFSGIKDLGRVFYENQYATYVSKNSEENLKLVNDFIKAFRESDDYAEYCEHYYDIDWINAGNYTKPIGTGETICVGFVPEYYPFTFIDADGTVKGNEVEFAIQLANYYNRKLEFYPVTAESYALDLTTGKIDFLIASVSSAYRAETEVPSSPIAMTDGYIDSGIHCIISDGKMEMKDSLIFDVEE